MSRPDNKTILIVCEGEGTEPHYFDQIRDILIDENLSVFIEIKPRPKKEFETVEVFKLRPGGKKRTIIEVENHLSENVIEEEYKAQPTRYVREAQMGLEDGTYEEAWAVFDKDGHPRHQDAFALAEKVINGNKVNIAFNSIAFEFWVLLHFEVNNTAFEKSMCRIEKNPLLCGEKKHEDDCNGKKCAAGRIVSQGYLKYENDRKDFDFKIYHPNVNEAIQRAVQLRKSYQMNHNPIYNLNPYTSTDKLVYKLLNLKNYDFQWFNFTEKQSCNNLTFSLSIKGNNIIIDLIKISTKTEVIVEDLFCVFDIEGEKIDCGQRKIITTENDNIIIDITNIQSITPVYFGIRINESKYLISELYI